MNVEVNFRDNVDAALARIIDPMQPFAVVDAKLLADKVKPDTNNFIPLPFIEALDLTRIKYADNQPTTTDRWDVKHSRYGAAGYYTGTVRIVRLRGNDAPESNYYFGYAETPDAEQFWITTPLLTDVKMPSRLGIALFNRTYYGQVVKVADQVFYGQNATKIFSGLLRRPIKALNLTS